jgi:hypothetical protein
MNTKIFSLLVTSVLLVTQFTTAFAQTSSGNWSAVQAIATDERLIVRQKDGKTIEGKMIEANETNLTLSRNNKVVNISRDSIRQIQLVKGKAAKGQVGLDRNRDWWRDRRGHRRDESFRESGRQRDLAAGRIDLRRRSGSCRRFVIRSLPPRSYRDLRSALVLFDLAFTLPSARSLRA